jgi:hypothetical protein
MIKLKAGKSLSPKKKRSSKKLLGDNLKASIEMNLTKESSKLASPVKLKPILRRSTKIEFIKTSP